MLTQYDLSYLSAIFIISYFFIAEFPLGIWTTFINHSPVQGHLPYLHFLATWNRVTMNMAELISTEEDVKLFGPMLRIGIFRLYGRFSFLMF